MGYKVSPVTNIKRAFCPKWFTVCENVDGKGFFNDLGSGWERLWLLANWETIWCKTFFLNQVSAITS